MPGQQLTSQPGEAMSALTKHSQHATSAGQQLTVPVDPPTSGCHVSKSQPKSYCSSSPSPDPFDPQYLSRYCELDRETSLKWKLREQGSYHTKILVVKVAGNAGNGSPELSVFRQRSQNLQSVFSPSSLGLLEWFLLLRGPWGCRKLVE